MSSSTTVSYFHLTEGPLRLYCRDISSVSHFGPDVCHLSVSHLSDDQEHRQEGQSES